MKCMQYQAEVWPEVYITQIESSVLNIIGYISYNPSPALSNWTADTKHQSKPVVNLFVFTATVDIVHVWVSGTVILYHIYVVHECMGRQHAGHDLAVDLYMLCLQLRVSYANISGYEEGAPRNSMGPA